MMNCYRSVFVREFLSADSGSRNANPSPRLAVFARWHHPDLQAARFPREAQTDPRGMWERWAPPSAARL